MKRVLVIAGHGMLGQMLVRLLKRSDQLNVEFTARKKEPGSFEFRIESGSDQLRHILMHNGPFDYLLNCAGVLINEINLQDASTVHRAIQVNSVFPYELSTLAQELDVRVINISTDGVFKRNAGICLEDSPADCDDIYGKTKSLGEVIAPGCLNIRCSIIGPSPVRKKGLLEWFMGQPQDAEVHGYIDQMWNGVTTVQFAKLCSELILQDRFDDVRDESSVHHFCPNQAISKYELLLLFKETFRLDISVIPVTSKERPVCRILNTQYNCLRDLFGYGRSMKDTVFELQTEM